MNHFDDDTIEHPRDFTLGVETVEGGYRWVIRHSGDPYCFGLPVAPDAEAAFRAGVAVLDQVRPKPRVRSTPPPQQPGSAPPSLHLIQPATQSEWHGAMSTMPSATSAPRVRNGFLKGRIARIAHRVGWRCCFCGVALTGSTATIEHLTAQADGGGNDPKNLELSCLTCNNERGRMPPDLYLVWRRRRGLNVWEGAEKLFAYVP